MLLQPVIYTKPTPTQNDQKIIEFYDDLYGENYSAQFVTLYPSLSDLYRRTAISPSLICFDHSTIFDEHETVFFDFCHIADKLNHVWAKHVVSDLTKAGVIDKVIENYTSNSD